MMNIDRLYKIYFNWIKVYTPLNTLVLTASFSMFGHLLSNDMAPETFNNIRYEMYLDLFSFFWTYKFFTNIIHVSISSPLQTTRIVW